MAGPVFDSAGTGAGLATDNGDGTWGGLSFTPTCPATVDSGDLLILQVFARVTGAGTSIDVDNVSGWTRYTDAGTGINTRHSLFYKVAAGTEDGSGIAVSGTVSGGTFVGAYARIYRFTGAATSSIFESGGETANSGLSVTVDYAAVTTSGADRLACVFIGANDDRTIGNFSGESGGDLTEATAEFTSTAGSDGMLSLQTAAIASAGTLSGGTATLSGTVTSWNAVSFAIKPAASAGASVSAKHLMLLGTGV